MRQQRRNGDCFSKLQLGPMVIAKRHLKSRHQEPRGSTAHRESLPVTHNNAHRPLACGQIRCESHVDRPLQLARRREVSRQILPPLGVDLTSTAVARKLAVRVLRLRVQVARESYSKMMSHSLKIADCHSRFLHSSVCQPLHERNLAWMSGVQWLVVHAL